MDEVHRLRGGGCRDIEPSERAFAPLFTAEKSEDGGSFGANCGSEIIFRSIPTSELIDDRKAGFAVAPLNGDW
jgi:hypothetical protein